MEIFGPTIHTRWDRQIKNLKDELTNWLVSMFGNKIFNRVAVLKKVGQYMNIIWDVYRVHLERNPRYECPLMIPSRDWKSLVEYGKDRALRKARKIPPGTWRYTIHSTM